MNKNQNNLFIIDNQLLDIVKDLENQEIQTAMTRIQILRATIQTMLEEHKSKVGWAPE